jgi:uncharacterized protein involved in exopolysaccharide biosynthesis
MPDHRNDPEPSKISLTNILFAIFKWKRTILGFTLAGIVIAAAVYHFYPKAYESDARLLVRYVLERSGYDPVDSVTGTSSRGASGLTTDAVIAAGFHFNELGFIGQVAEALGLNRVLQTKSAIRRQPPAQLFGLLLNIEGSNIIGSFSQIASQHFLPLF